MNPADIENALNTLFYQHFGMQPDSVDPLPPSGSPRLYFRLSGNGQTAIGTYNPDQKENAAFLGFSQHFKAKGLPVPQILGVQSQTGVYLQEDLGTTALYDLLPGSEGAFSEDLVALYERSLEHLGTLQIEGGKGLDYSLCYPRAAFDKQSMLWDFNTFKYYFLRLSGLHFDEQALEEEIHQFMDYLLTADTTHFIFRDFQSRNIMVKDGQPWFIDYQGGRKGALQYDLASLLYQAKANLPDTLRTHLLEHYLNHIEKYKQVDRPAFTGYFYAYVLMRTIQVLGTYGYRGIYERKAHFLKSIPFALQNIKSLFVNNRISLFLPTLQDTLMRLAALDRFKPFDQEKGANSKLTVKVNSFSYKRGGIPGDKSGNGGGFVFDCRFLNNPGRYEPYRKLTGRDESVKQFLRHKSQMPDFLNDVYRIVDEAVENYIERGFSSLMVNFGCTGGQHRSVYAADSLAKHLEEKYNVSVVLHHIEQEKKGWVNE
jgi:aminoglycoside/choline kinase family phosphotransferase